MNNWLQQHRWNITSQHGEDGVLAAIFERLNINKGWCIECGAGDGKFLSNTWRLINECGWGGVQIEAEPSKFSKLNKRYKVNPQVNCINISVGIDSMDTILSFTLCPVDPDLCVIDIDGLDYWVWSSMQRYKPKVVMIEFNPTLPFEESIIQNTDFNTHTGSSLFALVELGKVKGYELIAVTSFNAIFIISELFPLMDISDNSISEIAPPNEGDSYA